MKKTWYRSNLIKMLLIVVFHAAVALAAVGSVFVAAMVSWGVRIWDDHGNSYIESMSLESSVYGSAYEILDGLKAGHLLPVSSEAGSSKMVDLQQIEENAELSYGNTSGLVYSLETLKEWAESGWTWGDTDNIVVCYAEDGEEYYYYYEEFCSLVEDGKITFQLKSDYGDESEERMSSYILECLQEGDLTSFEFPGTVTDHVRDVEYVDIYNYFGNAIVEKYSPVGADSLLDAVNSSDYWRGRLETAYNALEQALDSAGLELQRIEKLQAYKEGNTNLTYLYVDLEEQSVDTNKSAYSEYSRYQAALKELAESDAYAIIRPVLAECESNLNIGDGRDLQSWYHMVEQESTSDDYVFAVAVDGTFPIADSLAKSNEIYNKFASRRFAVGKALGIAIVLFLVSIIWLTWIAGRRTDDEGIHLNGFDHVFTEIAAAGVFGIWVLGLDAGASIASVNFDIESRVWTVLTIAAGIFTAFMFLTGYLSLVRRIKAGTLWKESLLRWLLKWVKKLWIMVKRILELFSRNTAGKIKMTALLCVFLLFQFVITAIIFDGSGIFLLLLIFLDCMAIIFCIGRADGWDKIRTGLKRISGGELQYKIPTDRMIGDQKVIAEYINHIGEGLDAAVENSLRNERMKTELITNVSHDIKTPLTSIINYVDLLKRENFTDPKICGYLDVLDAKAQRLKVLTEDVVEASKASSGTIALEMADLNFIEMLHQVMGEFEEKFQEKNLSLMVHLTDEAVMIHADGRRLWRVLENVFNNVVKYAMEGTRVYAEAAPEKGKVVFSLKNISALPLNISADELTERFIRGDVSRNTEGSGLGLSIAKSLTELQGGEFQLYLDGDLFKVMITFPLIPAPVS